MKMVPMRKKQQISITTPNTEVKISMEKYNVAAGAQPVIFLYPEDTKRLSTPKDDIQREPALYNLVLHK